MATHRPPDAPDLGLWSCPERPERPDTSWSPRAQAHARGDLEKHTWWALRGRCCCILRSRERLSVVTSTPLQPSVTISLWWWWMAICTGKPWQVGCNRSRLCQDNGQRTATTGNGDHYAHCGDPHSNRHPPSVYAAPVTVLVHTHPPPLAPHGRCGKLATPQARAGQLGLQPTRYRASCIPHPTCCTGACTGIRPMRSTTAAYCTAAPMASSDWLLLPTFVHGRTGRDICVGPKIRSRGYILSLSLSLSLISFSPLLTGQQCRPRASP